MEPKKTSIIDYVFPIIISCIILFFSLHFAVAYDIANKTPLIKPTEEDGKIINKEYFNTKEMFLQFGNRISNNIDEIKFTESTFRFIGIAIFIDLIIFAYIYTGKRKLIIGKEYGTARWGVISEIKHLFSENIIKSEKKKILKKNISKLEKKKTIEKLKDKYNNSDMLLTKTEKICIYNYELNNNTLIIGGSGSGKTRGYIMPNLLQAHSSYIITDPKGEVLAKSGYFLREKEGYKIRVLNLDEKELSDGYNPFHYIHVERSGWEERILSLIETIIVNTDGGEKKQANDPFWDKAERLFLQAIFFAVIQAFPKKEQTMNTVVLLIRWLKIEEEEDDLNSDLDLFFEQFEEDYGKDNIAVRQFKEFREKASGKTAKSIVISAVVRLAPFNVKEVKRIFSYDAMQLERVGEEKTAIFVIVPPTDSTFNFIAGMLFTQLFQELQYCATQKNKHNGQKLPVPCRFLLDEFANTCVIPNFIKILAYARSFGVGITTVLQSLDQIKKMYKDEWGIIVDNSDTLLYLGKVKHTDTLKYLSELLGKGTYDKKSSSQTKGRQSSSSINNDKLGRELLDPAEIGKLRSNKCLLFIGGFNPFFSNKYDYLKHKNYKFTSDANNKYSFKYKPVFPDFDEDENIYTHREDFQNNSDYKLDLPFIEQEFGDDAIKYFERNVLNFDFVDDELLVFDEEEKEANLIYEELLDEQIIQVKKSDDFIEKILLEFDTEKVLDNIYSINSSDNAEIDFVDDELVKIEDGSDEQDEFEFVEEEQNEEFIVDDLFMDMKIFEQQIQDI